MKIWWFIYLFPILVVGNLFNNFISYNQFLVFKKNVALEDPQQHFAPLGIMWNSLKQHDQLVNFLHENPNKLSWDNTNNGEMTIM